MATLASQITSLATTLGDAFAASASLSAINAAAKQFVDGSTPVHYSELVVRVVVF